MAFTFYLGTHMVNWLSQTDVPLFISRRRLDRYKKMPVAKGPWALDSGGFSELSLFGEWTVTAKQYVEEVKRYEGEIGNLDWCSIQDYMCEPIMLKKTGMTVRDHQRLTIENFQELKHLYPEGKWTPVIQGWGPADYFSHIDQYMDKGFDLREEDIVGIGSVCRRQSTKEIANLVKGINRLGISIHGFGIKKLGLIGCHRFLRSSDSMAWSYAARRENTKTEDCKHNNCASCIKYALRYRRELLEQIC